MFALVMLRIRRQKTCTRRHRNPDHLIPGMSSRFLFTSIKISFYTLVCERDARDNQGAWIGLFGVAEGQSVWS